MILAVSFEPGIALSRLCRLSWQEVRVRLAQELWKRYDLAGYRLGFAATPRALDSKNAITGEFFFSAADLAGRVQCFKTFLPEEARSVVSEADEICRHHFRLLGYHNLDYGLLMDWHLDPVSGKRTPLKPWFKIHFLDYEASGDHKVIWELSRHQHLVALAKAWCLTGNKKYLDEITGQWQSWQQANPYPLGINWASSLEVAFRSLSWLWTLALVANSSQLPPAFRTRVVSALALNARHIERYLSTYFSPNTHLLGEAAALFFIGVLCPQFPAAARWRSKGWQILLQEAERQVRSDGVYFEQSLYYHVYALDFFLHTRILAARNGVTIPQAFDEKINKMLDVLQLLGQAGPAEGFGDDDGGRLFNPRRNRTEHLTDPLAVGALLYGRNPLANLTEEAIWLFGDQAVSAQSQSRTSVELQSRAFPDAGLYLMADNGTNMQLMIDAGPQGTGRSGHGHADALSILLSGGGRRWLVDSGTGRYVSSSDERATFRGTGAHNTLRVERTDQAVPEGPFAWNAIPRVKANRWVVGNSFEHFEGSHDGYTRLPDPVTHRRSVFLLKGKFWLVRDVAEGSGHHELEIFWHFAPDLKLRNENNAVIAESPAADGTDSMAGLVMQTCGDAAWASSLETAPLSPAYGTACSAPVVRLRVSVPLPADCAVLLIPQSRNPDLGEFSAITVRATSGVRAYRYQKNHEDHYFFFAETEQAWECGPWSSDAQFLYCRLEDGCLVHLILVAGKFCKWHDSDLVTLHRRIERCEWLRHGGKVTTSSSDDAAIRYSLAHELVCSDPVV
jgi:Heparinase II/III-like protein/Heparinase II/III N-terminus